MAGSSDGSEARTRQPPFEVDVTIQQNDRGYYSIFTSENSAMGRRILLLNPEEYSALEQEIEERQENSE